MNLTIYQIRSWFYLSGFAVTAGVVLILAQPATEHFHAPGLANPGHGELACSECHRSAVGTPRQQMQAKVQAFLGLREYGADFIHRAVRTKDCQSCHAREEDRHPVYRFAEPRFEQARALLGADACTGCHREHSGMRAVVTLGFCKTCHAKLNLKEDPLAPSHAELVVAKRWKTCLRCHDFHGNHGWTPPADIAQALLEEVVEDYLVTEPSPYGPPKIEAAATRKRQ